MIFIKRFSITILIVISGLFSNIVHTGALGPRDSTEEDGCFKILSREVQSQFGKDLSQVIRSERDNSKIDVSNYRGFIANHTKNAAGGDYFDARRNNIGTIIAGSNYIRSQFVSFGNSTNFTFPLRTNPNIAELGEKYADFRDSIVYTHHLISDGDFVSCGYLHISPKSSYSLTDLSQENYMTNTIADSGFELISDTVIENGKRYLVGKVRVGALSYDEDPLFKIDLITVAYDNQNSKFNEYETFPLQVRAMTNPDIQSQGVSAVQLEFLSLVKSETCLEIPHTNTAQLPSKCNGTYQSLSAKNPIANKSSTLDHLFAWLIPTASARLPESDIVPEIPTPHGMYINEGISLELQEKIQAIPDKNLQDYIRIALTPNFEDFIKKRQAANIVLTPFEQTFIDCGIPYDTRLKIIKEWVESLDLKKFDINTITYPDPKIGDCILPYPDESHKNKTITGSFDTNQMYAKILQSGTGTITKLSPEEQKAADKISLGQEYDRKIQEARINTPELVESLIKERDAALNAKSPLPSLTTSHLSQNGSDTTGNFPMPLVGGILMISGSILLVWLLKKNNTQQSPSNQKK